MQVPISDLFDTDDQPFWNGTDNPITDEWNARDYQECAKQLGVLSV
jgi:hypothetical protein